MTGPPAQVSESALPGHPGAPHQLRREIGRAAVLIGGITGLARIVGFGRQLVFAHTVGSHCLGTAYATANQVPNIVYDIVLGGAVTSVVVPVMAGAAARRGLAVTGAERDQGASGARRLRAGTDRAEANRAGPDRTGPDGIEATADRAGASAVRDGAGGSGRDEAADADASKIASALLTWAVLLLVPASVVIGVLSGPLAALLLAGVPGCPHATTASVSARMLVVFAPQVLFYGLAVVLYGILQAHRRFTAPALAPILSSLVVIGAYVAFVPLSNGAQNQISALTLPGELMLSAGTTAGVAALALTALVPAIRLRLRLRPALRFPPGVAARVRGLAAVGVAALVAQDASLVAVIVLANSHAGAGAVVLYNYGWQIFFVPYAVLAVPIATSAFPVLAAAEGQAFDRTAASSLRAVTLVSWLGAALLAGAAWPAARLFASQPAQARQLAFTFAAFAPGLVGYGLTASLSRVLFACGRSRAAAMSLVGGWLVVIAVDVAVVPLAAAHWVVPVLGLGNTVGLSCSGVALLMAVRAARSQAAVRGSGRAAGAGLTGALAGGFAGVLLSARFPVSGFFPNAAVGVLAATAAAAVFGAAVLVLDGDDLRAVATRIAGRMGR